MANRLTRTDFQFTPGKYFSEIDYYPDLTKLEDISDKYQQLYDTADADLIMPDYIPTQREKELLQKEYIEPFEQQQAQVMAELLKDPRKGISALRQYRKDLKREMTTGKFSTFQANKAKYDKFIQELDNAVKEEQISPQERAATLNMTLDSFEGSFDDTGNTRSFTGMDYAPLVEYSKVALEYADNWKASEVPAGAIKTKDGYINYQSQEYVSADEVFTNVEKAMWSNKKVVNSAYYRGKLAGYTGDDLEDYVGGLIKNAANLAAAKEGFIKYKNQYKKDWELEFAMKQAAEEKEKNGTIPFELINPIAPPKLDIDGTGKITGEYDIGVAPSGIYGGITIKKEKIPAGFDQKLIEDPNAFNDNPLLKKTIEDFPRKGKEETWQEYNKRIAHNYEVRRKSQTTYVANVHRNTGEQAKTTKENIVDNGYIDATTFHVFDGVNYKVTNLKDYAESVDLTPEEVKEQLEFPIQINNAPLGSAENAEAKAVDVAVHNTGKHRMQIFIPKTNEENAVVQDYNNAQISIMTPGTTESETFIVPYNGRPVRAKFKKISNEDKQANGYINDYHEYVTVEFAEVKENSTDPDNFVRMPKSGIHVDAANAEFNRVRSELHEKVRKKEITQFQAERQLQDLRENLYIQPDEVLLNIENTSVYLSN